ncbi:MAG: glycosyltransferase 87 family protein [Myxococcota bacterium]
MRSALHAVLCVAYPVVAAGAYVVAAQPAGTRGIGHIALHLTLTAIMLVVWVVGREVPGGARRVWWTGVLTYVLLVAVPSYASHDVLRYLWDGHVLLSGADPYRLAPAAGAIGGWALPPDNLDYPTLYPPGALVLFAAAAAAGPSLGPWVFRAMVLAAALAVVVGGARLLERRGAERHVALLALSPLLLLEAQVGAHLDVVATAALVGALGLYQRERLGWAGVVLGVGGLIKLVPLVVVLPLALAAGAGGGLLVVSAAATVALGYGGAVAAGLTPLGSLPAFFGQWEFGSPVFGALARVLPDPSARGVLAVLALGVYGAIVAMAARTAGDGRGVRWGRRALVVPLALSPVVFPWYLVPLVPLVALRPSAALVAWLAAVPLTYEVIDRFDLGRGWEPAAWPLLCIAGAWAAGWIVDGIRTWRPGTRFTTPPALPAPARNARALVEDVGSAACES